MSPEAAGRKPEHHFDAALAGGRRWCAVGGGMVLLWKTAGSQFTAHRLHADRCPLALHI